MGNSGSVSSDRAPASWILTGAHERKLRHHFILYAKVLLPFWKQIRRRLKILKPRRGKNQTFLFKYPLGMRKIFRNKNEGLGPLDPTVDAGWPMSAPCVWPLSPCV